MKSGNNSKDFPTQFTAILERIETIDPVKYGKTRNFIDGGVTYLSPYISRGVISTKQILERTITRGHKPGNIERFIQELAWRDYWQQVWIEKRNAINEDLKNAQSRVTNYQFPETVTSASTGIIAIDNALQDFYDTGYMHNHLRMYVASIICNIGGSHWRHPAQWMYYYLLDGDWASNALSWQWVAGANSNKKYFANQENINKYCYTTQVGTFLDVPYESFPEMIIPRILENTSTIELTTKLPKQKEIHIDAELPTCLYNYYNLDPNWKMDIKANRVFLLEPSHFEAYPVSTRSLDFALSLSENIDGIQVYVGEFSSFRTEHNTKDIFYKEHPLARHYKGIEEPRDWMFDVKGYYPSFFQFWKKAKKQLKL